MATLPKKRSARKIQDAATKRILSALRGAFPEIPEVPNEVAYRLNTAGIRLRIISARFTEKSLAEREEMVLSELDQLPDEITDDITMILMLSPREAKRPDTMSREFDDPDQN
jgi:hypothetical protein